MRPAPKWEKLMEVSKLNRGDIIKLASGEVVEFQTMKQKNFTFVMNGSMYSISINMFSELIEKAKVENKTPEIVNLKRGELFYIVKNERVIIFKFDSLRGNKIQAKHPLNNGNITVDLSLYAGKVSDLE